MKRLLTILLTALCASSPALAQVVVTDPWVRATVPAQKATGAFMTLTAEQPTRLLTVSSPAAAVTEIHEMAMEGDVMTMRQLERGLDLPAGKPVVLKPGSYHIMLLDLKAPVKEGTTVPLTLSMQGAGGKKQTMSVNAVVRPLVATPSPQVHGSQ